MSPRCVESWPLISSTITDRERIFRWKRTPRHRDPFSHRKWGESWRCPNSAGCITVTNDGLPEKPDHLLPPSHQSNLIPRYVHVRSRQSACSKTATNVGNPGEVFAERINRCGQDGIFVRHNAGSSPARVLSHHLADEIPDFLGCRFSTHRLSNLRNQTPVATESSSVPADHRFRSDQKESLLPSGPEPVRQNPENPIE